MLRRQEEGNAACRAGTRDGFEHQSTEMQSPWRRRLRVWSRKQSGHGASFSCQEREIIVLFPPPPTENGTTSTSLKKYTFS